MQARDKWAGRYAGAGTARRGGQQCQLLLVAGKVRHIGQRTLAPFGMQQQGGVAHLDGTERGAPLLDRHVLDAYR